MNNPSHERILIKGAYVLSQDENFGEFVGDVLVADGKIADVGFGLQDDGATIVNGAGHALLPGFIDTHRHAWQGALRGLDPSWTYAEYRNHVQIGLGPHLEPEDVRIGNLAADLMSLDAGVTTVRDESHIMNSPAHADAAIAAHWESGIRSVFAYGWPSTEAESWQFGSVRAHPADIRRVRESVLSSDSARVTLAAMLRGPELSTLDIATQDIALARDLGLQISMHVGLGEWGVKQAAVRKLHDAGLLDSDMLFIHACTSTDEELRMIADHGAQVSVASSIEAFMPGLGQPATNRMIAAGLRPSLSLDVETSAAGDLFGAMRAALVYQQLARAGATGLMERNLDVLTTFDSRDLLAFATINGARACGIDDRTGSITPGKEADLIMIRLSDLNLLPATDVAATIVTGAHSGNVTYVMVAGEVVKSDGVLRNTFGIEELASKSRDRIYNRAGLAMPGIEHRRMISSRNAGN
ncbi:amidohydrolase family protein [Shinella granuli]|uniref:Cytosine/adenosine deaminase-related metal-dependent hydrolase n=1 Tax=Shinella granuli TaxID=323621 RepID=A0A4R2BWF0_SHIGR|nr:amidohydrolase family protein [Shinella granuli]TCN32197.1 cytosine/adenosine deaminase-related metal-dependent hydrolase [Shinella granuli]